MSSVLRNTFLAASIFLATVTLAQAATEAPPVDTPLIQVDPALQKVVATVDDTEITEESLQNIVRVYMPSLAFHQSVSERKLLEIRGKSLQKIIDDEIFYKEAKVLNIKPPEKEVKASIKRLKKGLSRGVTLDTVLKNSNMTMEDLKDDIRKAAMIALIKDRKETELKEAVEKLVTDEYMKDYYDNNQRVFVEPERLRISEILIKSDPGSGSKGWKKNFKKAQAIEKRIRDGEDFAVVAKEVSEDSYAKNGGDMGWVHRGSLSESLEVAVSALKVGEMTAPVQSLYGYHLLALNDLAPELLKDYDDLNLEKLRGELKGSAYKGLWNKWYETVSSKVNVTILDEKLIPRKVEKKTSKEKK